MTVAEFIAAWARRPTLTIDEFIDRHGLSESEYEDLWEEAFGEGDDE